MHDGSAWARAQPSIGSLGDFGTLDHIVGYQKSISLREPLPVSLLVAVIALILERPKKSIVPTDELSTIHHS